jgi:ABC-2 type transport system ATP-binding protein
MTSPHPSLPLETAAPSIRLQNVSRWYGEVLGINKVTVDIYPGITGLVGPNGSGKSTLMNLICGLLWPGQGSITVLGQPASSHPDWRRCVGYCTQVDHFYENFTGREFIEALLGPDRDRKIRAYSKGMRQRVKIALAIAHQPEVLVLDEPFNGLDPVGRHEMMHLFAEYAREGRTILISSHILHEIDRLTPRILMMSNGYVMAEGEVHQVRDLLRNHPFQVFVQCRDPRRLAALLLEHESVSRVTIEDETSLSLATRDPDRFYLLLNDLILRERIELERGSLADENVQSISDYLAGREHH